MKFIATHSYPDRSIQRTKTHSQNKVENLPPTKGKKRESIEYAHNRTTNSRTARSGAKMAESDRGLWARNGETKHGKVSVGRAKISWTIDDSVRGRLEEGEGANEHTAYPCRNTVDRRISRKALVAAQKSLVGCCRKRRPSIPASLAAWLAGWPAGRSILPWLRRATWRRKKRGGE